MKVVYWNNLPAPYMIERFNALARREGLEFEAWFTDRSAPDRSWAVAERDWEFDAMYVPRARGRPIVPARRLAALRPDLLVSLYEDPLYLGGLALAKARGSKVAVRALKVFDSWRPRRRSREIAKQGLMRFVDAVQVAGPDSRAYVEGYGARADRVFSIPEPVDVAHFASGTESDRAELRGSLGLDGCVFLYVGRLLDHKGVRSLLESYRHLLRETPAAALVLVGDGADEADLRTAAHGLAGVHFVGFAQKDTLPRWYAAADALVFPTHGDAYGHVVQEAMAGSLPVISSTAAGDITDRVVHERTGLLFPPGDTGALLSCMRALVSDRERRRTWGRAGYEIIRDRTVDRWAERFEEFAHSVVEDRPSAQPFAGQSAEAASAR